MGATFSDLSGRTVLVTGAARGIGRAVALELAAAGARVLVHYHRQAEAASAVVAECRRSGAAADMLQGNVADEAGIRQIAADARRLSPEGLSGLVNNAGIYEETVLSDTSAQDWDRVLNTNLRSTFLLTKELVSHLRPGAAVVNTSSILGLRPAGGAHAYQASKAAVVHLTKSLALELAPGIRVNCIAPGFVMTDMNRDGWEQDSDFRRQVELETPLGRWGQPEDLAPAVRFLLSDGSRFITGQTLLVDGGKGL